MALEKEEYERNRKLRKAEKDQRIGVLGMRRIWEERQTEIKRRRKRSRWIQGRGREEQRAKENKKDERERESKSKIYIGCHSDRVCLSNDKWSVREATSELGQLIANVISDV